MIVFVSSLEILLNAIRFLYLMADYGNEGKDVITLELLYGILRMEKLKSELQKLDENFFDNARRYIAEKKALVEMQEKKDSIFSMAEIEKTRNQLKNARKMLVELYEKREGKIAQLALFSSRSGEVPDLSNGLKEEIALFNSLRDNLRMYKRGILFNIEEEEKVKVLKVDENEVSMKFLKPLKEFIGTDLKVYGPFEADEVVKLPRDVADMLLKSAHIVVV